MRLKIKQESAKPDPDKYWLVQITSHLALLEEGQDNLNDALTYLNLWKSCTPFPADVQKRIDDVRQKLAAEH